MITKSTAMVIAAAAMLASASAASAQGTGNGPVGSACAMEINRYCANTRHGGGAVRSCLEARRAKLSRVCKSALDNTGFGRRR